MKTRLSLTLALYCGHSAVSAQPYLIPKAIRVGPRSTDIRELPEYCPGLQKFTGNNPCRKYTPLGTTETAKAREVGAWLLGSVEMSSSLRLPKIWNVRSSSTDAVLVSREAFAKAASGCKVAKIESLGTNDIGTEKYAMVAYNCLSAAAKEVHFVASVVIENGKPTSVYFGDLAPIVYDLAKFKGKGAAK